MSLDLHKTYKYVNPYWTNLNYLQGMFEAQTKLLEEVEWNEGYINTSLWNVPVAWPIKMNAKITIKGFISVLNYKIMGL